MESPVRDPASTLQSFGRQFQLSQDEQGALEWAMPFELTEDAEQNSLYEIVNIFTRASQSSQITADSAHRLQKFGGEVLSMVSNEERRAA